MALITCPECSGHVSTKATACPHCGAPVESPQSQEHNPNRSLIDTPDAEIYARDPDQDSPQDTEHHSGEQKSVGGVRIFCYIMGEVVFGSMATLAIGAFGGALAGGVIGIVVGLALVVLIGPEAASPTYTGIFHPLTEASMTVGTGIGLVVGPIYTLYKGLATHLIMDWDTFRDFLRDRAGMIRHLLEDHPDRWPTDILGRIFHLIGLLPHVAIIGYTLLAGPLIGGAVGGLLYGIVWFTTESQLPSFVIIAFAVIGLISSVARVFSGARAADDLLGLDGTR